MGFGCCVDHLDHLVAMCWADAPFLYFFLGEVLFHFWVSMVAFWLCVRFFIVWLGFALFGNKFLIIQKKKKKRLNAVNLWMKFVAP